ncbi:hypothetical protein TNCV_3797731 [Trichonephila clavipes]|nr:hypothetical protein TNCV_3797731 [Trichonephila clavipes]
MKITGGLISAVAKDASLIGRIVTGNEKWCFLCDPQSKRASVTWKSPHFPCKQKFQQDHFKWKVHAIGVLRYPGHRASGIYP